MVIQLVSYKSTLRANNRLHHTIDIINNSTADLILFAGHTICKEVDIYELNNAIENKKTSAIIEVEKNRISKVNTLRHSLFLLQNGVVKNMFTSQLFADSHNINAYPELGEHLVLDLETRRKFNVANREVIVLQCGENGILRNIQSEGNKAVFRFQDNTELNARFENVIDNADIILNPIHSPMGNQGKMRKRREYFSSNNRAYFSTANFSDETAIFNKSLQYACINGIEQQPINEETGKRNSYIIRTFVI